MLMFLDVGLVGYQEFYPDKKNLLNNEVKALFTEYCNRELAIKKDRNDLLEEQNIKD